MEKVTCLLKGSFFTVELHSEGLVLGIGLIQFFFNAKQKSANFGVIAAPVITYHEIAEIGMKMRK